LFVSFSKDVHMAISGILIMGNWMAYIKRFSGGNNLFLWYVHYLGL